MFISITSIAQIKVETNGYVGIGSRGNPDNFPFYVYGGKMRFENYRYSAYRSLNFEFWATDPRFYSSTHKVVFYNSPLGFWDDIQVKTCYEYSDRDGKTDITPISNSLKKIMNLEGVSFYWKNDTMQEKRNIGFIAQEVEKHIPEVVIKDDTLGGYLISYSGIIPCLVEAIKDQQKQIETLQNIVLAHEQELISLKKQKENIASSENSSTLKSSSVLSNINADENIVEKAKLYQNSPNPFTDDTEINYKLPQNTHTAIIYIYNMQGTPIKNIEIDQRGDASITIQGNSLQPGMYMYTLITDGKEIDTKRMILTE